MHINSMLIITPQVSNDQVSTKHLVKFAKRFIFKTTSRYNFCVMEFFNANEERRSLYMYFVLLVLLEWVGHLNKLVHANSNSISNWKKNQFYSWDFF